MRKATAFGFVTLLVLIAHAGIAGCTRDYDDLFRGESAGVGKDGSLPTNGEGGLSSDGQSQDVVCIAPSCPAAGRCAVTCSAGCATCSPIACPSQGQGCDIECPAGSTCNITCPDGAGGCKVQCRSGATCKVSCQRGPCSLECEPGAPCSMNCGSGSCDVECNGGGDNKVSCGGGSEGCTSCPN